MRIDIDKYKRRHGIRIEDDAKNQTPPDDKIGHYQDDESECAYTDETGLDGNETWAENLMEAHDDTD